MSEHDRPPGDRGDELILLPARPYPIIATPQLIDLGKQLADRAERLEVVCEESAEIAESYLEEATDYIRDAKQKAKRFINHAYQMHRMLCDELNAGIAGFEHVRDTLAPRLSMFRREQERQRRAAELAAQEAQRKAAEEARQREVEALERAAAEAAAHDNPVEAKTLTAIAEEVKIAPVPVAPIKAVKRETTGTGRTTYATNYRAEVTDLVALIKAIIAGKVPVQAVVANQTFLDNQATQFKTALEWPGVQVVSVETPRVKRS